MGHVWPCDPPCKKDINQLTGRYLAGVKAMMVQLYKRWKQQNEILTVKHYKCFWLTFFSLPFPSQTHDHSVCIRPPLLPFNVTSQNATFQLKGSFVRSFELFIMLLKVTEWNFSHSKLIYFSQASIKELQVWRSQFNFKTQKPSFFEKLTPLKVRQAAQQHNASVSTGHVGNMQQF